MEITKKDRIATSRLRILSLIVFSYYSLCNAVQWVEYTIIPDIFVEYYQVSYMAVSWTTMTYSFTMLFLMISGYNFYEKKTNMKKYFIRVKFNPFSDSRNANIRIHKFTNSHSNWIRSKQSYPESGRFLTENFPVGVPDFFRSGSAQVPIFKRPEN